MREVFSKINKIFLLGACIIQSVFAVILAVATIKSGTASVVSFLVVAALIGLAAFFACGKKKTWILVAIYVLTLPVVMDTAVSKGHLICLPDAPKGTVEELKVQRLVWPYISEMGYSYGLDVMDDLAYMKLAISSKSLWNDFFPAVESVYGDYSQEIYARYVELSLESQKRKIVPDLLKDVADYFFAPITTEMNFYGYPGSLNGDNYQSLKDRMGSLAGKYYHFGFASFAGIVLFGIINIFVNKTFPGVKITVISIALILVNVLYSSFFPYRGFDYKNAVWIVVIWSLYWCVALRGRNADC